MKDYIILKQLDNDRLVAGRIFKSLGLLFLLEDLSKGTYDPTWIALLGLDSDARFDLDLFNEGAIEAKERLLFTYFQDQEPDSLIKDIKVANKKEPVYPDDYKMKHSAAQREVIQKLWQEPRLPGEKVKKLDGSNQRYHNKSSGIYWSQDARDLHFSKADTRYKLILEHATPISFMVKSFRTAFGSLIVDEASMHDFISKAHADILLTVITKAEDKKMDRMGVRESFPETPWARYEKLGGKEVFLILEQDNRYE